MPSTASLRVREAGQRSGSSLGCVGSLQCSAGLLYAREDLGLLVPAFDAGVGSFDTEHSLGARRVALDNTDHVESLAEVFLQTFGLACQPVPSVDKRDRPSCRFDSHGPRGPPAYQS